MKVEIFETTDKFPLQKIGKMCGVCWGSPADDVDKNIKRAKECIKSGHGRVLEFVDIEFCLSDISCRLGREWYTHIGGSPTRLQESTRYVDCGNFEYYTPDRILNNEEVNKLYDETMNIIKMNYNRMISLGGVKEDVANVLPLGMNTKIIDKRNLRNLINMFNMRSCNRAYVEYRKLMAEIKKQLSSISEEWKWICDNLFVPKCEVMGYCNESRGCGRKPKKDNV